MDGKIVSSRDRQWASEFWQQGFPDLIQRNVKWLDMDSFEYFALLLLGGVPMVASEIHLSYVSYDGT